jgi:hypothetical protein
VISPQARHGDDPEVASVSRTMPFDVDGTVCLLPSVKTSRSGVNSMQERPVVLIS